MHPLVRKLLIPVIVLLLLFAIAVVGFYRESLSEWLIVHDQEIRTAIAERPLTSLAIGFVIYLSLSAIPGTTGKSVIFGWLFGLLYGVLIVNAAMVAVALGSFVIGRKFLSEPVRSRLGIHLQTLNDRLKHDGPTYLLTLRLAHAPFTLMNYTVGACTDISIQTFWWTTQIGLIPGNVVFVFAGTRLPSLEELFRKGALELIDGPMLIALVTTVFIPWLARKLLFRRWATD